MLKKILASKWLRLIFSAILIYFAFKKVDIAKLFNDIKNVPWWFVVVNIIWTFLIVVLVSIRWNWLLFPKTKIESVLVFIRTNFLAYYYSLFFPTAIAGDVLKWMVINRKHKEIPKVKVLGSIVLDRFIGFSIFMFLALISAILGKKMGLIIPDYIFYLLIVLSSICFVIYVVIYFFDVSKFLPKIGWLHKLDHAFELLKDKNKGQIVKCVLISVLSETIWIIQAWFVSWKLGVGLGLLSVFVFMPIIATILILPISIGGFGAREQLFLFFFSQLGGSNESILLMSTFLGIMGIFNSLFGGILSFSDQEIRKNIKVKS